MKPFWHSLAIVPIVVLPLLGCGSDGPPNSDLTAQAYEDWLYHSDSWYDEPFWIWVDDHPDCCGDGEDLKEALGQWWETLDPEEQEEVRERADNWLDERGLETVEGQSKRDLILDTASDRWESLTPEERQNWLEQSTARIEARNILQDGSLTEEQLRQRVENLTPEQRQAVEARLANSQRQALPSNSLAEGGTLSLETSGFTNHPMPGRSALRTNQRFRSVARGRR